MYVLYACAHMQLVRLNITDVCTENSWDSLRIYDGNSITDPLIASVLGCSVVPIVYTSTEPFMLLRFTSDASVVNRGFAATYTFVTGGDATSSFEFNAVHGTRVHSVQHRVERAEIE
jgi:hypothetical protein